MAPVDDGGHSFELGLEERAVRAAQIVFVHDRGGVAVRQVVLRAQPVDLLVEASEEIIGVDVGGSLTVHIDQSIRILNQQKQPARSRIIDVVPVTGYSGLRISRSGRRFWIQDGVIWQLMNEIRISFCQAPGFRTWRDA